jgi:hypothetical protein
MGFLDGLISELTGDYNGTDSSNGSKLGVALGKILNADDGSSSSNQAPYIGCIYTEYVGSLKRKEFIEKAGDVNVSVAALQSLLQNGQELTQIVNRSGNDWDGEDQRALDDVAAYIANNYNVTNRDVFFHIVKRSENGGNFDGWAIWSHYLNSDGLFHYAYYFTVG